MQLRIWVCLQPIIPLLVYSNKMKEEMVVLNANHPLAGAVAVDGDIRVGNCLIGESADDVDEGIHAAEVVDELASRPLALAEGFAGCGEINVLDGRIGDLLRLVQFGQAIDARVGHVHDADVRLRAGAVRANLGRATGDGVEHRRLSGAGESDNSELHGA